MSAPTKLRSFEYEAIDTTGKRTRGVVDGASETAAIASLRAKSIVPLKVAEKGVGLKTDITIPGVTDRIGLKDLAIMTRQFATMTGSGLSLLRSLTILEEQTPKPKLRNAVRDVRRDIEAGVSLSAAMRKQDRVFPRLMVAMIEAGETGGFLDQALDRVATNFEKDARLRAKIKTAMTYPVIVLCFSVLLVSGVLIFIVPVFQHMFSGLHASLPTPTMILVKLSNQAVWVVPLGIGSMLAAVAFTRHKTRTDDAFRLSFDKLKLRLPVFGKLFAKVALSRWSRNLGTLLNVGVPVMQALDIVGGTSGNEVIAEAMKTTQQAVREGRSLSSSLAGTPLFPAMVVQMIEVGEESGQLSAMLDKVADFYDHEVEATTEQLAAAIEPIMIVLMGGIVGSVVVALYLPMFTVYQHIQGSS